MENIRVDEMLTQLKQLLAERDYATLKRELMEIYPMDLAEIFEELPADERLILFRLLQKDHAAEVFSYLGTVWRKELASSIRENLLKYILDELYFDDKIDFLEEMPSNFVKDILRNAPAEERALVNQFLHYPENSAGSLMTIEYVDLKKHMTVKQALERIKAIGSDTETIYTCYVLDDTRRLEGIISLRRLVLASEDMVVADLMNDDIVLCGVNDDQEDVAEIFKKYDLMTLPVTDGENRLTGIITIDDIVDVIEQENTEDFHKMAAMAPLDRGYMETGVFMLARQRIVWLLVLMVSAIFTGGIIGHYQDLLNSSVALAIFIPMLMDSGGNAGSQSSTLIIRSIALGEIELNNWPLIVWKELRVGILAGGALAIVNLARMLIQGESMMLTITVSATLMITIVIAKLVGGVLPIVAKSIKMDPAIMASPLITTIVDALSLFVYFGIASRLIL